MLHVHPFICQLIQDGLKWLTVLMNVMACVGHMDRAVEAVIHAAP
jgi:hypothetical protein